MRRLVPATVVGLVLLMASHAATALGLGRVSTQSYLGNPLEFTIALSAQSSDALSSDCITADVYAGDSRVPAELVRVRVNRGSDGTPTSLRVLTGTRIDEPVASVELTLDCGTRVTRKYVVFVDPPLLNLAQSGSGDSVVSTGVAPRSPSSARDLAPSAAPRRSRPPRSSQASGSVQAGGTGAASAAREQRRAARAEAARAARAAAPPAERGSRLKLESAPAIVAGAPVKEKAAGGAAAGSASASGAGLTARTAAAAAAAANLPPASAAAGAASAASGAGGGLIADLVAKAEADALALNAERLKALEERMNRLRSDNQSLQKSMLELQTRLAEAEATRYANPLVYALAAGLLLLLLALIVLLWRQASLRKESEWLKAAAADAGAAEPRGDARPAARSVVTPSPRPSPAALAAGAASVTAAGVALRGAADETAPGAALRAGAPPPSSAGDAAAVVVDAPKAAPPAVPAGPHESTSVHDPRREVTVEELIDLEQQADFFVVLGQDDAAIDLLMGHVQGTGGASPLPYLKLLEIHRRRDERDAYDRVRERFNRRFSAFAPEWDAHTGHDRALEDYPSVIERLQGLWPKPTQAMDALAGLLFQRDLTAQTFDLPAYGELLFLYSLARELAEHEPPADGVDLLLPLDDGGPGPQSPGGGGAKLAAGVAAAGGLALAASDLPSLDPFPGGDLPELPDSPTALPPTYPVPLAFGTPEGGGLDEGLLDLNISDDPEEPKGPLSKY